jgi:hypothetical protein
MAKSKSDDIPEWVTEEIRNAKFKKPNLLTGTGYILEVFEKDKKADVQLYEPIEDGRHIVTMDLSKDVKMSDLERGIVYEFEFNMMKAVLKSKVVEYLLKEKEIDMKAIYQFELKSLKSLEEKED